MVNGGGSVLSFNEELHGLSECDKKDRLQFAEVTYGSTTKAKESQRKLRGHRNFNRVYN